WDFTNVETDDLGGKNDSELDRTELELRIGFIRQLNQDLQISSYIGGDLTRLTQTPTARTVTVTDSEGTETTVVTEPDKNQNSLAFGGALNYSISSTSSVALIVDQFNVVDIDGDNILTRTFALNGYHSFSDRLEGFLGASLLQFANDSSLSGATDRYLTTASMSYRITESVLFSFGYNYVTQDVRDTTQEIQYRNNDYEGHRAFISLDAGIVGL